MVDTHDPDYFTNEGPPSRLGGRAGGTLARDGPYRSIESTDCSELRLRLLRGLLVELVDWPDEDCSTSASMAAREACRDRAARSGRLSGRPPRRSAIVRDYRPRRAGHRTPERLNAPLSSEQAEVAQAHVPSAADDQVIVHGHAERLGGFDDIFGDGDVRLGRSRVARGVVVHQDHRRGLEFERPLDHFARIDRCVIDRSALLLLVLDQYVLSIKEQDVELLDLAVGDVRRAVIDELVPGADHRTFLQFRPHQPECGLARRLERSNPGEAEPG